MDGSSSVRGQWAVSMAQLLALDDTSSFEDIAQTFSGSYAARAAADGGVDPAGALSDDDQEALLGAVASAFGGDDAVSPVTAALAGGGERLQSPANASCTMHKKPALKELTAALKAYLHASDNSCGTCGHHTAPLHGKANPSLGKARPKLFGVYGMPHLWELQTHNIAATRSGYVALGKDNKACAHPPLVAADKAADPLAPFKSVESAAAALECSLAPLRDRFNEYALAAPPITTTMIIDGGLIPDGYKKHLDTLGGAYTAALLNAARAVTKDRVQYDRSTPRWYEVWNEPDKYGNSPIAADKLVPLAIAVVSAIKEIDPDAKFFLGTATGEYLSSVLQQKDGLKLMYMLDAYNLHPYGNWPSDDQDSAKDRWEFGAKEKGGVSLADGLRSLAANVMLIAGNKPIHFTEAGYNADPFWSFQQGQCYPTPKDSSTCDAGGKHPAGTQHYEGQQEHFKNVAGYVTQLYHFIATPPADIAAVVDGIETVNIIGFPDRDTRLEVCSNKTVPPDDAMTQPSNFPCSALGPLDNALKGASVFTSVDATCNACAKAKLGNVILALRKASEIGDFVCCATATAPRWLTFNNKNVCKHPGEPNPPPDTSPPNNTCGDGKKAGAEQCDGSDFGGETCETLTSNPNPKGPLKCKADCTYDTSACSGANCSHDACTDSPIPLDPQCNACAQLLCGSSDATLQYCCNVAWDSVCLSAAAAMCGPCH